MPMKRLRCLDAMRGLAILFMIPYHTVWLYLFLTGLYEELETAEAVLATHGDPLATGLPLFFFITGASLVLSSMRRLETGSPREVVLHIVLRYVIYILTGMFLLGTSLYVILGVTPDFSRMLSRAINVSDPIASLGLTAIVALPFIHGLSWRQLTASATAIALLMSLILSQPFAFILGWYPLNILFTNTWAVLKTIPLMFVGAAVTKLLVQGQKMKREMVLVGGAITLMYIFVPPLIGAGTILALFLGTWAYYHSILFSAGASLFLLGIIQMLDDRHVNLTILTVVGRVPLVIYYLHFSLLALAYRLIGPSSLTSEIAIVVTIIIAIVSWILCYLFSKRRWGSPSEW